MKCEILTWKNTFKHKKLKHILSIPFFYIKRLLFVNKFSQKNLDDSEPTNPHEPVINIILI